MLKERVIKAIRCGAIKVHADGHMSADNANGTLWVDGKGQMASRVIYALKHQCDLGEVPKKLARSSTCRHGETCISCHVPTVTNMTDAELMKHLAASDWDYRKVNGLCLDANGYPVMSRGGKQVKVHCFVWEQVSGKKRPHHREGSIDHRDRDRTNFRPDNLRMLPARINSGLCIAENDAQDALSAGTGSESDIVIAKMLVDTLTPVLEEISRIYTESLPDASE